MHRIFASLFLVGASFLLTPLAAWAVTIDTVPVGDVGNSNDPADGDPLTPGIQNFGGVNYAYRIGKYEVTNAQYVEFLNAKAASDPLNLYDGGMGIGDSSGGITRSGVSGSYTYTVMPNMGNKPVNNVNWYTSLRFANWLHNGQGASDTETGAYTLLGGTPTPSNAFSITRNAGATWFLPSEDEWYKAAYYDPRTPAQGGPLLGLGNYWPYPTASSAVPTRATANSVGDISNPGANVANYRRFADWNGHNGNVTTVGSAGPLSYSFYGTADQGGNVYEWNESLIAGTLRSNRGGSMTTEELDLRSTYRNNNNPLETGFGLGFRVATVAIPEPSTAVLVILGSGILWWRRKRRFN